VGARDQDLRYAVLVQDRQLKELHRNIRALNKEMGVSESAALGTGNAATGYAKADRAAKQARKSSMLFGSSMKDVAKTGALVGAGFASVEGVARFLRSTVPAALEAERSLVRLETQLEAVDLATEQNVSTIEKAVRTQTLLAGVIDDEVVRDALTNMVRSTRDVTRAVELNSLALDIAIAKNISLETSSRLVARVNAGNTGSLGRYGIMIDKSATSMEALTILQERFAGQAARAGETAEGKFGRFHFRVEELKEDIGAGLIPVLTDVAELAELTAIGLGQIRGADLTPGFDMPDVPEWLKPSLRLAPLGPLGQVGGAVLGVKKALEDSNDEMSVFDRLAASAADSLEGMAGDLNAAATAIEKRLRTKLGAALEDVHDKALSTFDKETDAILRAQDRVTEGMFEAFDRTTDKMVEKLEAVVHVGERQFTIGQGKLTPAERELEALEKIDRKRNIGRELHDAREELGLALLVGDPKQIQDAKRRIEDAETERKKIKLEKRAETERAAADKAIEEEERALRDSRDNLRDNLEERRRLARDDLSERRKLLRDNLDAELKAHAEALSKGKTAAGKAQREIISTLRKFGADYAGVGKELGGKFLEGFAKGISPTLKMKLDLRSPDTKDAPGAAIGGIAGQLGRAGPSDTLPAWLTPGEMVLTKGDQRQMAALLGSSSIGRPLLTQLRMGFATGGIADEELWRRLLMRFSGTFANRAASVGTGIADPRFLTGGFTDAERRMLSPLHVQSQVKFGTTAAQRGELGRSGLLALYGELAQRSAHPRRSGFVRLGAGGLSPGRRFRDPGSGSGMNFGDVNFSFPNVRDSYQAAMETRRQLIRLRNRNPDRKRGRNKGSRVGLG